MGVFSNNRPQIVPGALISSSYLSDVYDVLTGQTTENVIVTGSLVISGSSIITSGITASLFGTSSWAVTASHALNAKSASYAQNSTNATTASFALSTNTIEYVVSSSLADLAYTASYYDDNHLLPLATFNALTSSLTVATASYYNDSHLLSMTSFNIFTSSFSVASPQTDYLTIAISDEINNITTGSAKITFRMPYAGTLQSVKSSLTTAPSGSAVIVDINNAGVSILSTKLSIDSTEKTSKTSESPVVISNNVFNDDDEITIDVDQIGSIIAGKGLKIYFKTLIS